VAELLPVQEIGRCLEGASSMNDIALLESPAPMEGHGVYNRNSEVQATTVMPVPPLLERAAREAALPPASEPIVIADYGSSEGRNSLPPMRLAIRELRRRDGQTRPISTVHTDQSGNDFSTLFKMLASDPDSYLRDDPNVFASAVGRSFYEQILPCESVTLGWSSWAVNWLSCRAAPIPDHVIGTLSGDAKVKAAFRRQAAADWRRFLTCRSRELRPGGRLVMVTLAQDETGQCGYDSQYDQLYGALLDLAEVRLITQQELRRMAVATFARSREEWCAPFAEGRQFAGLALEEFQLFDAEDPLWADFARHRDAGALAARRAAIFRAFAFPSLAAALDGGLESPRTGEFAVRLEAAMAARLAAAPDHGVKPMGCMLLAKVRA
jgi:hypothetical protein